ncbi:hypothetical protein Micbo1qcDRAFT_181385 [Microdochium bolleyi]|uniref:Uncharacterized protein n=1 Tax=Microdochium bolleyi TaxID=196109 RepID=A0A136IJD6_9PEZI|nr:hypothetical protein Micbo1qcDRAFT_181385 [Microdochium bolleyi]
MHVSKPKALVNPSNLTLWGYIYFFNMVLIMVLERTRPLDATMGVVIDEDGRETRSSNNAQDTTSVITPPISEGVQSDPAASSMEPSKPQSSRHEQVHQFVVKLLPLRQYNNGFKACIEFGVKGGCITTAFKLMIGGGILLSCSWFLPVFWVSLSGEFWVGMN